MPNLGRIGGKYHPTRPIYHDSARPRFNVVTARTRMDSLMLSPLQLHLRLLPLPNPFVGTRKNPNEFRRIGKSWCFPLAGNGNRFVVSSPLRSWSRLAYSTTATARHKPCSRYAVLGAGFSGMSVAWHLLKVISSVTAKCMMNCLCEGWLVNQIDSF